MLRRPQKNTPGASCISVEAPLHLEDCQVLGLETVQPHRVAVELVCDECCLTREVSNESSYVEDRSERYRGLLVINTYGALDAGPSGRSRPASIHTYNFDLRHYSAHTWASIHHTSAVFCDTPHSLVENDGLS